MKCMLCLNRDVLIYFWICQHLCLWVCSYSLPPFMESGFLTTRCEQLLFLKSLQGWIPVLVLVCVFFFILLWHYFTARILWVLLLGCLGWLLSSSYWLKNAKIPYLKKQQATQFGVLLISEAQMMRYMATNHSFI